MLKWLRKYSRSWFIAAIIGGIVVVFIFWGVGGLKSPTTQEVAEVNGAPILMPAYIKQFNQLVKEYQERMKGEMTAETIKMLHLREMALGRLVDEQVILQAAGRMGLAVSDAELQENIRKYPVFQENGHFNERRYFVALSRAHLNPVEFEDQERLRLLMQKVYRDVTDFAKTSDLELEELYRMGKEEAEVSYLVVSPEKFTARQHPSDADVERYYQENQAEFKVPVKGRAAYLFFKFKDFADKVKPTAAEVEAYLKEHEDEFTRPKVIVARQLLLTLPPQATPDQRSEVEARARELQQRALAGEDFAELARSLSQDQATRDKGGELGEVKAGQNPPEWDRVAFALKPGEVGPATTPKGIYLIQVEEIKERETLPDAQARILQRLKDTQGRRLAQEAAKRARTDLSASPLGDVAKKFEVPAKETPLIGLKDQVPDMGVNSRFNQAVLDLKPKEVSQVIELKEGLVVLQGLEHQDEHLPPLSQIKDKVREALKLREAGKVAGQEAARLLELLRKGESLAKVASQAGLTVNDSGFFTRVQGFLKQPQAEVLTSAAFQLSGQKPYVEQPLLWQDKYYLLAFKARRAAEAGEFQKERDKLLRETLEGKKQLLFTSWLKGEKDRAKIKIYDLP